MKSLLSSLVLLVSFSLVSCAAPPPPPMGNNGVRPGVGPDIQRPSNLPRPQQPGYNGVRPGVGPDVLRPAKPDARPKPVNPRGGAKRRR